MVAGCNRTALPPRLTPSQRAYLAGAHFSGVTIGVERFHYPVYSDRLALALRATHLFAQVDIVETFATAPTFVARVERPVYGTAMVPLVTVLSLGLIPTTVEEEYGYAFSLARSTTPAQRIPVEFTYHDITGVGWRPLFVNLRKDGTLTDVYRHSRLHEALAWEIVQHRQRICQYADTCGGPPSR
jgi:hypothetical protein